MDESLKEALTHPVATASAVISATIGYVSGWAPTGLLDAVVGSLWAQAGPLFAAASVSATQLAPQFAFLPADTLQVVALVLGVLFVATRLDSVIDGLQDRLED